MVASHKVTDAPSPFEGPCPWSFHAIPANERRTSAEAIDALQNRFSAVDRQSVRAALRSRCRKPDEDLFETAAADDVLLLADRASMDSEALDQLEPEAFFNALDFPLRRRVRAAEHENPNAALSRVLVFDA